MSECISKHNDLESQGEQAHTCINNGINIHDVSIALLLSDRQQQQLQLLCDLNPTLVQLLVNKYFKLQGRRQQPDEKLLCNSAITCDSSKVPLPVGSAC